MKRKRAADDGYCGADLSGVLRELIQQCPFDELVEQAIRADLHLSADNEVLLAQLTEQLAIRLMSRASLFAQQRTKSPSVASMRVTQVQLLKEDLVNAWKSLNV